MGVEKLHKICITVIISIMITAAAFGGHQNKKIPAKKIAVGKINKTKKAVIDKTLPPKSAKSISSIASLQTHTAVPFAERVDTAPKAVEGISMERSTCTGATVTVIIQTDNYGDETSWELIEVSTETVVASGGNYGDNTYYDIDIDVCPTNCYYFTVYDSYDDGMCCDYGNGYFQVFYEGEFVGSGGSFGASDTITRIGGGCGAPCETVYNNTNIAGFVTVNDGYELIDFGTTDGGTVCSFDLAYVTSLANPGTMNVTFYSGINSYTCSGTMLASYNITGLEGSPDGEYYGYYSTVVLDTVEQFDLPVGDFGYSISFDNIDSGPMIASGGMGNMDTLWLDCSTVGFEDDTHAGLYLSIEASGGTALKPDLQPYQPTGWDDKLVCSNVTGTTTSSVSINDEENVYVDFNCANLGYASAGAFRYGLYLDNVLQAYVDQSSLDTQVYSYVTDYDLGKLSVGSHNITIKCDYNDEVDESDETNNEYTRTINIIQYIPPDIRIEPTTLNFPPEPDAGPMQPISACPDYFEYSQPDGTKFMARKFGDARYHWMETEDGWTIKKNKATKKYEYLDLESNGRFKHTSFEVGKVDPAAKGLRKHLRERKDVIKEKQSLSASLSAPAPSSSSQTPQRTVSTTGTVKNLVILANFSDTSTTFSQSDFNGLFNTIGYNENYADGSFKDYYLEVSYGNLTVETTVSAWVTLPHGMAYYGANDSSGYDVRPREMVEDAIAALDATGFNFAPFDEDGDGWVDSFSVIHQGQGEEAGGGENTIWSHKWGLSSPVTVDGVKIQLYHTEPEKLGSYLTTIGVICHEFGHALGLPDLYDTDYSSSGIGDWGIMASGSWNLSGMRPAHMCAWSKAQLGWVSPTVLNSSQNDIPVAKLSQNAEAYKITAGMVSNEYLLIENRQTSGGDFDEGLPHDGMLIYHIDDSQSDNDDESRYLVKVLQADGDNDLENGINQGDSGDPFPGATYNRYLDGDTNPNTDSYVYGDTGIIISEISDSASTMTFDYGPPDQGPEGLPFTIYNDGGSVLEITSIVPETPAPWISIYPQAPFSIQAGQSQEVIVTVDMELAPLCGETTTRLIVRSNDPDENPYPTGVDIVVTGEGTYDDCQCAEELEYGVAFSGSTEGATATPGNPVDYKDVWHSFTAPISGTYAIHVAGQLHPLNISVYDSCGGTLLLSDSPVGAYLKALIELTAGQTYYISVCDTDGHTGGYDITVYFAADFDKSGFVDVGDLREMAGMWLVSTVTESMEHDIAPVPGDMIIDLNDLAELSRNWFKSIVP